MIFLTDFGYERFDDGGFPPYPEGGYGDAGFNRGGGGGNGALMAGGGAGGGPLMKASFIYFKNFE